MILKAQAERKEGKTNSASCPTRHLGGGKSTVIQQTKRRLQKGGQVYLQVGVPVDVPDS